MRKNGVLLCLIALLLCVIFLPSCSANGKAFSLCREGHDLVGVALVPATCTEDGSAAHFVCNRCQALFDIGGNKTARNRLVLPAAHQPSGVWLSDEAEHYQACLSCGEAILAEKHSFADGVCSVCGILKEDTTCKHQGGKATCQKKAICENCGKPYGRLAAHSKVYVADDDFLASEATCTKKASYHASCSLCGFLYAETFTDGALGAHDFSIEDPSSKTLCEDATCSRGATYYKTCSVCGKVGEETFVSGSPKSESHRFSVLDEATGDLSHTLICDICGEKQAAEHSGKSASCTASIVCDVCKTFFVPNTHVFTLKLAIDDRLASAATCQSPATYFYSCEICERAGKETFSQGEPADHSYLDGLCIWCGKKEE